MISDFTIKISGTVAYTDDTSQSFESSSRWSNGVVSTPDSSQSLEAYQRLYDTQSAFVTSFLNLLPGINLTNASTPTVAKNVDDFVMEVSGTVSYDDNTSGSFVIQWVNGTADIFPTETDEHYRAIIDNPDTLSFLTSTLASTTGSWSLWEPSDLENEVYAYWDPSDLTDPSKACVMRAYFNDSHYQDVNYDPHGLVASSGGCRFVYEDTGEKQFIFRWQSDTRSGPMQAGSFESYRLEIRNSSNIFRFFAATSTGGHSKNSSSTLTPGKLYHAWWCYDENYNYSIRVVGENVDETITKDIGPMAGSFASYNIGSSQATTSLFTGYMADFVTYKGTAHQVDSQAACDFLNGDYPLASHMPTPTSYLPMIDSMRDTFGNLNVDLVQTDDNKFAHNGYLGNAVTFDGDKIAVLRDQSEKTIDFLKSNSGNSYAELAADLSNSAVFSMGISVYFDEIVDSATYGALITMGNSTTAARYYQILIGGGAVSDIRFLARDGTGISPAIGAAPIAQQWTNIIGVSNGTASRKIFVNGVSGTEDTSIRSPAIDRFTIGAVNNGGTIAGEIGGFPNSRCDIANAWVIAGALTDNQVAAINDGADPRLVAKAAGFTCTFYSPLGTRNDGTTIQDLSGSGNHVALVGSPDLDTSNEASIEGRCNFIDWRASPNTFNETSVNSDTVTPSTFTSRMTASLLPVGIAGGGYELHASASRDTAGLRAIMSLGNSSFKYEALCFGNSSNVLAISNGTSLVQLNGLTTISDNQIVLSASFDAINNRTIYLNGVGDGSNTTDAGVFDIEHFYLGYGVILLGTIQDISRIAVTSTLSSENRLRLARWLGYSERIDLV